MDDEVPGDEVPEGQPVDAGTPRGAPDEAFPVSSVELALTKHQSADLGEVLSRSPGLNVQRRGGLGSDIALGLYGVQGSAVRVLLDDLPLELSGYSQSLADLPLFQLSRVDVYRGVVPIRFGVDAREGVVNVIAPLPERSLGAEGYYQVGSFGTHRAGVSGHYRHESTGLFARLSLYGDLAQNDYDVTVQEPDANGRINEARVSLFHNRYRAAGADVEVGVLGTSWAERLTLRAFMQRLDRDIQSNAEFTVPYGEVRTHTENRGVQLRFEQTYAKRLRVEAIAGYAKISNGIVDDSSWTYDWRGERRLQRNRDGETGAGSGTVVRDELYARATLSLRLADAHALQLSLTPRYTSSPGQDVTGASDVSMFSLISGLAYVLTLFDGVLENNLFGKSYVQSVSVDTRSAIGAFSDDQKLARFGVGDALLVRIADAWQLKASYELATRLPSMTDVVGNGGLVIGNPNLKAESSHNSNLQLSFAQGSSVGSFRGGVSTFLRKADNEILTVAGSGFASAYNVLRSRTVGVETRAGWSAPRDWLTLDANLTFADSRNESQDGVFSATRGERLPARPYMFANATARTFWRDLLAERDEVSLSYYYRFVQSYSRSWESIGAFPIMLPSTHLHTLALTYLFRLRDAQLGGSVEAQNLTDRQSYGPFGVQLPGRAFYLKLDFQI